MVADDDARAREEPHRLEQTLVAVVGAHRARGRHAQPVGDAAPVAHRARRPAHQQHHRRRPARLAAHAELRGDVRVQQPRRQRVGRRAARDGQTRRARPQQRRCARGVDQPELRAAAAGLGRRCRHDQRQQRQHRGRLEQQAVCGSSALHEAERRVHGQEAVDDAVVGGVRVLGAAGAVDDRRAALAGLPACGHNRRSAISRNSKVCESLRSWGCAWRGASACVGGLASFLARSLHKRGSWANLIIVAD